MSETKSPAQKPKKEVIKLPDLNQNFSDRIGQKTLGADLDVAFSFNLSSLERLLTLYRFAKDDKSSDLTVFFHGSSIIFLKEQLDSVKAGAVPVELVKGDVEDIEFILFNLDYALLQQVYTTMKQIERDTLILELKNNNTINYVIGSFNLPGKLKNAVSEVPYSVLDEIELESTVPSADLNKILDASFNSTESNHTALDNIFIDSDSVVGGTRGLLYRSNTLLPALEDLIGFNYKYYQDIAAFRSLAQGEINLRLGKSKIRGKVRDVLEFSSYDCRLVVPLAILSDGDKGLFQTLKTNMLSEVTGSEEGIVHINCTVKALRRSLQCMELALYGLTTIHKVSLEAKKGEVTLSATPLTNEKAVDTLTCSVVNPSDFQVGLTVRYLFDLLASFEADDNIVISVDTHLEQVSHIKVYGKTKSGNQKIWVTATSLGV
jgi:hypothetical protein